MSPLRKTYTAHTINNLAKLGIAWKYESPLNIRRATFTFDAFFFYKVGVVLGFWEYCTSIVTCPPLTRSNRNSGDRGNVDLTLFQNKKKNSIWVIQVYCNGYLGQQDDVCVCVSGQKFEGVTCVAFKYSMSFRNPHQKWIQQVPKNIHQCSDWVDLLNDGQRKNTLEKNWNICLLLCKILQCISNIFYSSILLSTFGRSLVK